VKPIDLGEILPLAEYESVRGRFRARVIAEKRSRRIGVGPWVSAVFENRDTVLLQIQEMIRTERITRAAAIKHEIDTYNELLPGDDELSCTLMIEIDDRTQREAFLTAAKGFEGHVWLVTLSGRVAARSQERSANAERTTAVHYLKFSLPKDVADAIRCPSQARWNALSLEIDHPAYAHRAELPAETIASLGEDLG
jgi:Protein of unknown function (DUF3501)